MSNIDKIAESCGSTPQTIRLLLQREDCKFGTAFKKPDSRVYTYVLYPQKVLELFGVRINENSDYVLMG